jgi:biopolymer transport protein ExbD
MAGGARMGGDDDEGFNDINIVPLVDIMLVLLIIFMVTTEFVDKRPEIPDALPKVPIELPSAASADRTQSTTLLSIALNETGDVFLNGEKSSLDGIKARVAELKTRGDKTEAFVAADKRLAHGQVVAVIDALRLLGVADVALNTKPMEID